MKIKLKGYNPPNAGYNPPNAGYNVSMHAGSTNASSNPGLGSAHTNRERAVSTSSNASEDFINAPLDLPESSDDDYAEDAEQEDFDRNIATRNTRRKHFQSESPRPRRGSRRIRIRESTEESGQSGEIGEQDEREYSASDVVSVVSTTRQPSASTSRLPSAAPAGQKQPNGKRLTGFALTKGKTRSIEGQYYHIEGDELQLPDDPQGEAKIDSNGSLQGGRAFKSPSFTLHTRANKEKVYMLAIDAARVAGFRDSLYFFRRNPFMNKINCTQEEKDHLIAAGRLHINLKSRQVTLVTARNIFKVFGARAIKDGKNVIDDYYEAAALARGLVSGTPAYCETYDPTLDNTTLAMPKTSNYVAARRGPGRPPYMKIADAVALSSAAPPEDFSGLGPIPLSGLATARSVSPGSSSEDDGKGGRRKKKGYRLRGTKDKKSPFYILQIPSSYSATLFGTLGGAGGAQFGGNGMSPFGEHWEKSKARKPAPHLNGRNWMIEYAKTVRESNNAYLGLAKAYSAYHTIGLGKTLPQDLMEEQEGTWDLSENEEMYESLEEYTKREAAVGEETEPDDRRRGRSPSISLQESEVKIKPEDNDDATMLDASAVLGEGEGENGSAEGPKKRRRRRSPLRGFYDSHTMHAQVRRDTQSTKVLEYEQVGFRPKAGGAEIKGDKGSSLFSIEYALQVPLSQTNAGSATLTTS